MINFATINLNNVIKVKLNQYGLDIHKQDHLYFWNDVYENGQCDYPFYQKRVLEYTAPIVDEEGYSTFQLWNFINIYGKYFDLNLESPIEEFNVLIEVKNTA